MMSESSVGKDGNNINTSKDMEMAMGQSEVDSEEKIPAEFLKQLAGIYDFYLKAQVALANDNAEDAHSAFIKMLSAFDDVDMKLLAGGAHMQWMEILRNVKGALKHINQMKDISALRKSFIPVSENIIKLEKTFGHSGTSPHRIGFCPMAADGKGARWLQVDKTVNNPYYGASMLRCGEIRETFSGKDSAGKGENDGAEK
jgi:Cu(I)/Ag(I) efflux system membrane fusion protein